MILCFDIGGTTMKGGYALSPEDITLLPRVPTPGHDFNAFVQVLRDAVAGAPQPPTALAISMPGVADRATGRATLANIPCCSGRLLAQDLRAALDLPVVIANDADCFVLAEAVTGAGRDHRVVFGAILGTGVGGGLVIDGALINASGGFAGEWGHGPVTARIAGKPAVTLPAFACGCGLTGCLDPVISARGIERLHQHLHKVDTDSIGIVTAWQAGDPMATQTVDIWCEIASGPLAMLTNTLGADIIPVGGGLSGSAPLIDILDQATRALCLTRYDRPLVVQAKCKTEPGLVGAAILGFRSLASA